MEPEPLHPPSIVVTEPFAETLTETLPPLKLSVAQLPAMALGDAALL